MIFGVLSQNSSTSPTNDTTNFNPLEINMVYMIINIVLIALGILFCFVGYRLFRFTFFIVGFLFGFGATYMLLDPIIRRWMIEAGAPHPTIVLVTLIIAGGLGLIIAILMTAIKKIGIFALGALLGLAIATVALATPLGELIANQGIVWLYFVSLVGSSILFGLLALLLQKIIMVIGTAFGGSFMIASALDSLAVHSSFSKVIPLALSFNFNTMVNVDWKVYVMIAGVIVVGITGTVVQFRFTARNYNHNKKKVVEEEYKVEVMTSQPDPSTHRYSIPSNDPISRGYTDRIPLTTQNRNYQ